MRIKREEEFWHRNFRPQNPNISDNQMIKHNNNAYNTNVNAYNSYNASSPNQKIHNNINIITCKANSSLEIFKKTNNCYTNNQSCMKSDRNPNRNSNMSFEKNTKTPRSNNNNTNTENSIYNNPFTRELEKKSENNSKPIKQSTPSAKHSNLKLENDFSYDNGITHTPGQKREPSHNLYERLHKVYIYFFTIITNFAKSNGLNNLIGCLCKRK